MKKKLLSFLSLTAIAIFAFAATQSLRRAATTIWENADGVVVNWNGDVTVAKDKFANLKIGDIITVTVKDVAAGATKDNWKAQVSLRDAWWNTLEQDVPIAESDTKAEFTVTGDIQAILQERGLMISGKGFSATKIEISDGTYTGSKNSIWIGNTTAKPSVSNFHFKMANGGYNDNDVWKNGVKAGDIIRIAATAIADFSGDKYCLLSYSGADTEYAWKDYQGMPAVATETGFDVIVTEGNVAQLMKDGIIVNQAGYTITQVELIPMYAVNVATGIENGTVEVDKATAAEGETVTVTATPAAGYKLFNALARGVTTDVAIEVKNGKFTMPADAVTVSATFAQPEDIAISPESGADIYTALKAATTDAGKIAKNITINLAADGAYTISNTIEVPAALTIAGPATLTEGQKAPTIDASGLANPFIVLKGSTVKAKKSDDTESTFLWYGNIEVKNVKVSGVAKQFVKTSETARIDRILLENSEVQYAGQVNIFDLGSSFYTDLTIKNSTVWAPTATNHNVYLIKCDGRCENFEKIGDVYPGNVTTSIINSTLYNIARGQKLNNSNGQMKGKTYNVQKMENSILINVGTKVGNEVNGWMFGSNSTNMKMSYANNTYITLSDADEVANVAGWTDATKGGSDQSGTSLTTNPGITYAKAEAGDFTIGASTAQAKMKTGDPRWLVAFTGYTITMGTVTNGTVEAGGTSPYFAGEKVRLTLTPAEGYAIDNTPTFKNDADVDVTDQVEIGQDADGFYLIMPAFNITASYAFSKLYTITLPTETMHGTITIVKPEGTNKSVAGKQIKIKVTGLSDGYKVVAKNGDTDITLNEGDHATYDYYFEMPEGDVTISIEDATGINAISVDGAADIFADGKPVYNLAGQRVFKGYKGLVIKNGKKVVVK